MALTRNQSLMKQAIQNVREVEAVGDEKTREIYGSLCHKFPMMVLTCGLCQAVAFIESKEGSGSGRGSAHALISKHISTLLNGHGFNFQGKPSKAIAEMPMRDYARATRILLSGWIYYKRFAESILRVESASEGDLE